MTMIVRTVRKADGWRARLLCAAALAAWPVMLSAGEPRPAAAPRFSIQEKDLPRVPVPRNSVFPWENPAHPAPGKPKPPKGQAPAAGPESLMDVSGNVVIQAFGTFSRVVQKRRDPGGRMADKEILTLNKDVEIEQPKTGSVLRGQTIQLVRDLASGNVERLEATGQVEIVMPGQSAKGASLVYETRFGKHGELLKHVILVRGDKPARQPATLWSGGDAIQSFKFVMDLRLDTFRAVGGAVAEVRVPRAPGQTKPAPPRPAPPGGGILPSFSLAPGAKVTISCDGEMLFESFSGRLNLKRNVTIEQGDLRMSADEVILRMENDQTPEQTKGKSGVFAGRMRSLECRGRIETVTPEQVMQCDRLVYDFAKERIRLEMREPARSVNIYLRQAARKGPLKARQLIQVKHYIEFETRTHTSRSGGPNRSKIFQGPIPRPRASRLPLLRRLKRK